LRVFLTQPATPPGHAGPHPAVRRIKLGPYDQRRKPELGKVGIRQSKGQGGRVWDAPRAMRTAGSLRCQVLAHIPFAKFAKSLRPRLAASVISPLRFADPSPPSSWVEGLHLQAVEHVRHTTRRPPVRAASLSPYAVVVITALAFLPPSWGPRRWSSASRNPDRP
jgi:hypothetical protein